jgi:hypothetical protein
LEPLQATFGRLSIRSAYRAPAVNEFGNRHGLSCASNLRNYGRHIWDHRDITGAMGAMATVVVPWFADCYRDGADWRALAWWIHDHLPYSQLQFFPKLAAFNIGWHEQQRRRIDSFIAPKGCLTRPGMTNHNGFARRILSRLPRLRTRQTVWDRRSMRSSSRRQSPVSCVPGMLISSEVKFLYPT